MKNYIPDTLGLVLVVVVALIGCYFLPPVSLNDKPLRKVDLLSDVRLKMVEEAVCDSDTLVLPPPVKPAFVDTCKAGMTCIEDFADSTLHGMKHFYEALSQVGTMDRPVRIAYFGDSFIEADILTADLREMLQQKYGGCGVGYVPITSAITGYRPTVQHSYGGWSSHASTDTIGFDKKKQGISGHYFFPYADAYVQLKGVSKYASRLDTCEVSTLYFEDNGCVAVRSKVNNAAEGKLHESAGTGSVQAFAVEGKIGKVRWSVEQADSALFYGVAMDGKQGVTLDNFSVRGSSGLHLRNIPRATLRAFHRLRPYDLIVIQYGLNVATERGRNYDGYKQGMCSVIEYLKEVFPETSILLVGVGDREYKNEDGDLRTMPGVKNLIRYQQSIAADTHVAFWNLFEAMGGEGSIVDMVEQKMANLDYTHINFKGGKHVAGILFETLVYGQEQYEKRKAYEEE